MGRHLKLKNDQSKSLVKIEIDHRNYLGASDTKNDIYLNNGARSVHKEPKKEVEWFYFHRFDNFASRYRKKQRDKKKGLWEKVSLLENAVVSE